MIRMTKAELIEALKDFDDDADLVIYVEGLDTQEVTEVKETQYGEIAICNSEAPRSYDLSTFAQAYYENHGFNFEEREAFEYWKDRML